MTVGKVIVTMALLTQMYQVPEPLSQCVVYRESSYMAAAVLGLIMFLSVKWL